MCAEHNTSMPWEVFAGKHDALPWDELELFAEVLASDPSLWEGLEDVYERSVTDDMADVGYGWLYVPSIVALAAPSLDAAMRSKVAEFLVEEIVLADEDALVLFETLVPACGSLGEVAVPVVLRALDKLSGEEMAWDYLWELTVIAADSTDEKLREGVTSRAEHVLRSVRRGDTDAYYAAFPAWALARLGHTEARPLLECVWQSSREPDIHDALELMNGTLKYARAPETWTLPVRRWLPDRWLWSQGGDKHYDEVEFDHEVEFDDIGLVERDPLPWDELDDVIEPPDPHFRDNGSAVSPKTVGRNDPCPCGSGKKYKRCCGK